MKHIVIAILALVLAACASTRSTNLPVKLDEQSYYYLQSTPSEMIGQSILQQLIVSVGEEQHELLLQTELIDEKINMVGLSSSGFVLFELTWDIEHGATVTTNVDMKGIQAEVMLAYFQLSNWPLDTVRLGINELTVKLSPENPNQREFYRNQQLVFSVLHTEQYSQMVHHLNQYQIDIVTLEKSHTNQ